MFIRLPNLDVIGLEACFWKWKMEDGMENGKMEENGASLGESVLAVNVFCAKMIEMLNQFGEECQVKLDQVSIRVNRTTTQVALIEAKLKSFPDDAAPTKDITPITQDQQEEEEEVEKEEEAIKSCSSTTDNNNKTDIDEKYLNLLKMGMPIEHVKLKMESEGADSSKLIN